MEDALGRLEPPSAVLDTNAVLDWLAFRNPAMTALATTIEDGRMRWLACARMRDELARVLRYTALERWQPDSKQVLTSFDRWARLCPTPPSLPTHPVCTDPDDQIFVDLALNEQVRWLITRDRALLKLARRAATRRLRIVTPELWTME